MGFCAECRRGGEREVKTEGETGKGQEKVRENGIKSLRKSDGDVLLTQPKERVSCIFRPAGCWQGK